MINNITPEQAAAWLAAGDAILIDVREPDEFKNEHIAYAASLPLGSVCDLVGQLNIPDGRKVIFQCLKGGRGQKACMIVGDRNICANDLYNIDGGITAWKELGLPVVTTDAAAPKITIFRQVQIIAGGLIALLVMLGFLGITVAFLVAGVIGGALLFAGLTGWCGLAMLLSKMPWNK